MSFCSTPKSGFYTPALQKQIIINYNNCHHIHSDRVQFCWLTFTGHSDFLLGLRNPALIKEWYFFFYSTISSSRTSRFKTKSLPFFHKCNSFQQSRSHDRDYWKSDTICRLSLKSYANNNDHSPLQKRHPFSSKLYPLSQERQSQIVQILSSASSNFRTL